MNSTLLLITVSDVDNAIDRLQAIVVALQHVIGHVAHIALPTAAALAVAYVLLRLGAPTIAALLWPPKRVVVRMVPPADSTFRPEAWTIFYRSLLAITPSAWKRLALGVPWVTLEYRWSAERLEAWCSCPADAVQLVTAGIQAALPGSDVVLGEARGAVVSEPAIARARLRQWREPLFPLGSPHLDPLPSVVTAMTTATEAVLQIALEPDPGWERQAQRRLDHLAGYPSRNFLVDALVSTAAELVSIFLPFAAPNSSPEREAEARPPSHRRSLPPAEKAWTSVFRADVRLLASARSRPAAKQAIHAMIGCFRSLDGANGLRPQRVLWTRRFDRALADRAAPGRGAMRLSPEELALIFHLPAGAEMETARVRIAGAHLPERAGSVLCQAEGGRGRLVRIAQPDRRQHIAINGPTGSGKSALLMSLALQDVHAQVGVGAIDPKGDLITDLCERIPEADFDRVVVVDPSHRETPVGLNVLECPDPELREVVCDSLVTIFRKTFQQFWGPRTEDVLRASLLTVMRYPELTICEVPLLLLNDGFRAALTKNLDDPIGLRPFWNEYEQLSQAQRLQMIGPVLNKLRAFLLRPTVRNILGQSRSTIDLRQVMNGRAILLVSLAKGLLGEDISRLLGAFIVARIWQTALTRISMPAGQRPDFNLYLDEFQNYLHLPQSLDDVLAEARAYGLSLTMANQHYGQLRDSTREAISANARTHITFQCSQEDAHYLAREFAPLTEQQLQNLQRFQAAVRLCVEGHTARPFTGVTLEPPATLGAIHAERLVRHSLSRYGRPRGEVEAEMQSRLRRFGIRGDFTELAS